MSIGIALALVLAFVLLSMSQRQLVAAGRMAAPVLAFGGILGLVVLLMSFTMGAGR